MQNVRNNQKEMGKRNERSKVWEKKKRAANITGHVFRFWKDDLFFFFFFIQTG